MIKGIDRIGIAVRDLNSALSIYTDKLGFKVEKIYENEEEMVRTAVLSSGRCIVELIQPLSDLSPVARFLEKRGEGVNYISLYVENLDSYISHLESLGFRILRKPPSVIDGRKYTFIHPKDTRGVMFELTEY